MAEKAQSGDRRNNGQPSAISPLSQKESQNVYPRALPKITRITKPFFEAARKKHQLVLQRCNNCGTYQWYPRPSCIECLSHNVTWTPVSGRGTVYSFTVIRQIVGNPGWDQDIPFVVAIVELDEGVRLEANVVGCKPEEVFIGMKVSVFFEDVNEDIALYKFKPA